MLKKVIIGVLCFIILAITAAGIYIYTLDWNKHKSIVALRLTQITGLNAKIDGNLDVELFPKPTFSAGLVKFTKGNSRTPLIEVNDISANIDLLPLLSNEFILNGMTLTGAEIHLFVDEKGNTNWSGKTTVGKNKSGNIEVSFNDVKMTGSSIIYENKKNNKKFTIPNISANISAPSLKGPYKTSGKFIYNKKEINFNGNVENNKNIKIKMNINSAAIASKLSIDGTLGDNSKGTIIFDGKSLYETITLALGEGNISKKYNEPMYLSFTYGKNNETINLSNFNVKYGNDTVGNGSVVISKGEKFNISSDIDMLKFNLNILENIGADITNFSKNNKDNKELSLPKFDMDVNIKSDNASYNGVAAHKLNMGIVYNDGIINLNRFAVTMPGETTIKSVGKITIAPKLEYILENTLESKDIKTFASIFNINLTKKASSENKKSIFQRAQAEFMISGGIDALKLSFAKALVDNTNFSGNLGFVFNENNTFVILQADLEKILFDKYVDFAYLSNKQLSVEDKILYQLNLSPWKGNYETDASISIKNAVYNNVALDNLKLNFVASENKLDVKELTIGSMGGAEVNIKANLENPYTAPYFSELSYNIKTTNFPNFITNIGLDVASKGIFKRKTFASQGVLNGSFKQFNISSIQKLGDTEISYVGAVINTKDGNSSLNGDIELKSNNFVNFAHAIGFVNYKPDLPVTTITLEAQLLGTFNLFELNDINGYLGTNNIQGLLRVDNTTSKPKVFANLSFDEFNINNMLNISKKDDKILISTTNNFIDKIDFSDDKIDLSSLNNVDFDITTNVKQTVWNNKKYADLKASAVLNNGVLNVKDFSVKKDDGEIDINFILDSNNLAKINGNYNISKIVVPSFGGKIYKVEKAVLNSKGSFSTNLISEKSFYDNLNAKGNYHLSNVTIGGWDLDIIKFELEQRKSIKDLNKVISNNLKTGKTLFNKANGKFELSKGVIISDNSVFSSPVENVDMKLNLNFSNWQLTSDYSIFYNNASFSDVVKFSLFGDVSNPELKINIDESIERINEVEKRLLIEKENNEKQKTGLLRNKIDLLQKNINDARHDIDRLSFDFIRYKPTSDNKEVVKVYEQLKVKLKNIEKNINKLETELKSTNNEIVLIDLETSIIKEISNISSLPKSLEENFIVESKDIFDNSFSKLTWLFNLAQNNSSYYNSLVDVYMKQIDIMKTSTTPVAEETVNKLKEDTDKISADMDKINALHNKIRDNYLNIIDSSSVNDMKRNNELALQAIHTMLSYIKQLNDNIVNSIDVFRAVLDIEARDYDTYLLYPPETVDDIDISLPILETAKQYQNTTSVSEKENNEVLDKKETPKSVNKNEENLNEGTKNVDNSKKKDELKVSLSSFTKGVSSLFKKLNIKNNQNVQPSNNTGIGNILANISEETIVVDEAKVKEEEITPVVVAEVKEEEIAPVVVAEVKEKKIAPVVVAEVKEKEIAPVVVAEVKEEEIAPVVVAEVKEEEIAPVVVAEVKEKEIAPVVVAEVKEEEIAPVVVAEVKEEEIAPVVVAEVKEEEIAPVVVAEVKEEEITPVAKVKEEDIDSSIIDKTKLALSDIISDIYQKEETIFNDIKHQDVRSSSKSNLSSLKTNPVIAMNIGNRNWDDTDIKASFNMRKRKGFNFKKDSKKEEIKVILEESANEQYKQEEEIAQQTKRNFLKLFANSNDNFTRNVDIETSNIVTAFENEKKDENNKTHYIFANTSTIPNSGVVNKSFLANKKLPKSVRKENKYIFASNNVNKIDFSGSVGKKIALSVK